MQSHLEYVNTDFIVWHPRYKKDVEQTERFQRRAIKLNNTYNTRYAVSKEIKIYDLPSLVYSKYRGNMTGVYEIICVIYTSGCGLLSRAPRSVLRGHEHKLKKSH